MLYVFIVSSGVMLKFDMNLAIKKVIELKKEISRKTHIPPDEQVLMCNGGEEIQPHATVGNYSGTGTDTNPIFLFSKFATEIEHPFSSNLTSSIDMSIAHDVEDCANMSPSVGSATVKLSLAQRFAEYAEIGRRECEELVHSQHLQQQGWAAVIANLEDAKDNLIKRKIRFEELFYRYLKNRSCYLEIIYTFPKSIDLLDKIPLLPKLVIENESETEGLNAKHTLLSWFISEPKDVLETLVEKCHHLLEQLNDHTIITLNEDFQMLLKNVDNTDMKEIKGIGERLSGLNSKVEEGKQCEKDQRDMSTWFNQYQPVIANDPQSIPSICKTFQTQLEIMLQNHRRLRSTLDICIKTKAELSNNIITRLKVYISKVESEMYKMHMQIVLLESHVNSVMSQVESYQQVQLAPQRYLNLLAEVYRRKIFSANYFKWAKELSSNASKMYYREVNKRKSLVTVEAKNMVDNLFPGMNDLPPPFAIECPPPFDQNLPDIAKEDLEFMKISFPELSHFCEVIPPDPMPYLSQAESDSAFSSNVPSSRVVSDSVVLSEKILEEIPTDKLVVPSADYSSLPSEYASLPNEVFSLTSSPFEDPLLPSHMQEERTNALQYSGKSASGEHAGATDSDGEEFETLDHYRTSPVTDTSQSTPGTRARPTSSSDVIDVNIHQKHCPKVSKARSDGDAVSPMQERFKSPDSLAVSTDFQSAEYYIDDSMPSSYTESNATSPLMRGSRMVKSHHVVISELQKQVEEKSGALIVTKNSLENTHSNILKLHAKISALQKYIQELQGSIKGDLSHLKAFVTEELSGRMAEVSEVVSYIISSAGKVEQQLNAEKEIAISEAKSEFTAAESTYLRKLEIESQKLNDAEYQIAYYEDHLRAVCKSDEETKHEKDLLELELQEKKELIQRMMLEHELEYDSFKNTIKEKLQGQESEINQLKQCLSEAHLEVEKLGREKGSIEKEVQNHQLIVAALEEQQRQLESQMSKLQEEKKSSQDAEEVEKKIEVVVTERNQFIEELEKVKEEFARYKEENEKFKAIELTELEEKLSIKHKNDLETLRSRFKLAVSMNTIALENSSISTSPETCDPESLSCLEELKQIVAENLERWESNQLKIAQESYKKELGALQKSAHETYLKHEEEKVEIIEALKLKHENSIEKLKSRITAENQVSFNEAINGLAKEKDSIIENLRSQISALETNQFAIKSYLDEYNLALMASLETEGSSMTQSAGACAAMPSVNEHECFQKFKADIEALLQLPDTTKSSYQSALSTIETCENLRKKLKIKEEEYNTLLSKFMNVSTSNNGAACCANKVSILTCEPGEIVLVNYEERLEHYIVFHLGSHLHFLHSDSVASLDLKIPAVGLQKWAIGVVTHKEFCITKKVNNRFKLTLGTKFFRVKVEKWRGGALASRIAAAALQQSIQPAPEPKADRQTRTSTMQQSIQPKPESLVDAQPPAASLQQSNQPTLEPDTQLDVQAAVAALGQNSQSTSETGVQLDAHISSSMQTVQTSVSEISEEDQKKFSSGMSSSCI